MNSKRFTIPITIVLSDDEHKALAWHEDYIVTEDTLRKLAERSTQHTLRNIREEWSSMMAEEERTLTPLEMAQEEDNANFDIISEDS